MCNFIKSLLRVTLLVTTSGLALSLVSAPAWAHCPHKNDPNHWHCDDDGSAGTDNKYDLQITGAVLGHSGDGWFTTSKSAIGYSNPLENGGALTDLSYFEDAFSTFSMGTLCFGTSPGSLIGGNLRERRGKAEGMFVFEANAFDEDGTPVDYVLKVFGDFQEGVAWPP